jgi:hypothetical protein
MTAEIAETAEQVAAQITDQTRNVLTLEAQLAAARLKLENTLFMVLQDRPHAPIHQNGAANGTSHPAVKKAKPRKTAMAKRATPDVPKPKATVGRKPSPDSAASKVIAAMKPDTTYTAEGLAAATGLPMKTIQSAIGSLRAKEKIATPERGTYSLP